MTKPLKKKEGKKWIISLDNGKKLIVFDGAKPMIREMKAKRLDIKKMFFDEVY